MRAAAAELVAAFQRFSAAGSPAGPTDGHLAARAGLHLAQGESMTHPDDARDGEPAPDPLTEAIAAYSAAFSGQGLPFLRVLLAGGPEERRAAMELLHHAVAARRPLDERDVMDALGIRRPPDGPVG